MFASLLILAVRQELLVALALQVADLLLAAVLHPVQVLLVPVEQGVV